MTFPTGPARKLLRITAGGLARRTSSTAGDPVPATPTQVQALDSGLDTAAVTWTPGQGGGTVASFEVVWTGPAGSGTVQVNGEATRADLSGLEKAATYTVGVTAIGRLGVRSATATAELVMRETALAVPSAAQAVAASSASPSSAFLSWRVPLSDGGSPILRYNVGRDGTDTGGTLNYQGTVGPDPLPGQGLGLEFLYLHAATTYQVWVEAVNAQGVGPRTTVTVTTRPAVDPPSADKERLPHLSFDRTVFVPGVHKLVISHCMAIYHTWDNNEFPLILQGTIAADADRTAKATGLTMADTGKFWRVTSTGKCWVWVWTQTATASSGAFVDYGTLPAYTTLGKPERNPRGYMTANFLPVPVGKAGRDAEIAAGGRARDFYPPDPRRHSDQNVYGVENALTRIRNAAEGGVNAFALHLGELPSQGPAWVRSVYFLTAAERFNAEQAAAGRPARFYWLPSFDGLSDAMMSVKNADGTTNHEASANALANACTTLKDRPGWLRIDNRYAIFPFGSHLGGSVEQRRLFWTTYKRTMAAAGMPVYFITGVLNDWRTLIDPAVPAASSWRGLMDAVSDWGARDPQSALSTSHRYRGMTAAVRTTLGIGNWTSVAPGDYRPWSQFAAPSWHEQGGFDTLRNTWAMAYPPILGGSAADSSAGVQEVTDNDYAEGSHHGETDKQGKTIRDVQGYWQEWWRTGTRPTFDRCVIYVAHRCQFLDDPTYPMTYTGGTAPGQVAPVVKQTVFAVAKAQNQTPARNDVHALVDIPAAWTGTINVRCSINGTEQTPSFGTTLAQPNTRHEVRWRLKPGRVRVWVERAGQIVQDLPTTVPVSQTQPVQDLTYFAWSSARLNQQPDPPLPPAGTAPGVPTTVSTSGVDNDEATLTWQPPATAGTTPVSGYRVARNGTDRGGSGAWNITVPATARSQTFTGLLPSTAYTLTVQAVNDSGPGVAATRTVTTTADPVEPGVVLPPTGASLKGYAVGVNGLVCSAHSLTAGITGARLYFATDEAMTQNLTRTAVVPLNAAGYARHTHGRTAAGAHYFRVVTVVGGVERRDGYTAPGRVLILAADAPSMTWTGASCAAGEAGNAFSAAGNQGDPTTYFNGDAHYDVRPDALGAVDGPELGYRFFASRFYMRPAVQNLWRRSKVSITPSDHDNLENDSTGEEMPARWANWGRMYREMAPIAVPALTLNAAGGPAVGVNHTWDEGPVRFIALDTRSLRSSWRVADSASKTYLGAAQEAWFENLLATLPANMLAVVIGDNAWNGPDTPAGGADGWRGYPTARKRFADAVIRHLGASNPRLIYCAGDRHHLSYDDGSRNPTAAKFAQCHAAPWWTPTATTGSQATNDANWTGGSYPAPGQDATVPFSQYGRWTVTRSSTQLRLEFRGHNQNGVSVFGPHVKTWAL